MKADWSKAPEWAQFWAIDNDRSAYWFEDEPYYDLGVWMVRENLVSHDSFVPHSIDFDPSTTLEKRPT